MNDFLSFRKMITPLFIQAIFWFMVVVMVIVGLITMIGGFGASSGQAVFSGLFLMIAGPLFARIYCELLIILFRIYDELVAIRTGTPPSGTGMPQGFPVSPAGPAYMPPPPPGAVPPPQYPPGR